MSDDERKYFAMHPSGGASHGDSHGNEEEAEIPLTPIDRPLDLAAVRAKLRAKTGKQYWRTLDELAEDPHFDELMHREFPRHASEWDESVDRRNFLKLMGASLAFAGLAGCKSNEQERIIPYVKQPDGMVLGKPLYFATVMPFGADAIGVLVESHEGRPTNLAGNPDHPSSMGGIDSITQASILNLYDPDRAKTVSFAGSLRTWSEFSQAAQAAAADIKSTNGAGFRILTGTITSPTLADQLQGILKLYPQAKWHQWESAISDGVREGGKLAFGRYVNTVYRPERAEVILSLDSDFLASGPGHIRYMRQFYRRRKLDTDPGVERVGGEMNRLYVVEPTPTVTGSSADHRLPLRASQIDAFARALGGEAGSRGAEGASNAASRGRKVLEGRRQELAGASRQFAGDRGRAAVAGSACDCARDQRRAEQRRQHAVLHRAGGSESGELYRVAARSLRGHGCRQGRYAADGGREPGVRRAARFRFRQQAAQGAQHRAAEHALRRNRAAREVARRRVALPRRPGAMRARSTAR